MQHTKNRVMLILIILLVCAALAAGISAIVCRKALTVREYDVPVEGVSQPFTAVCITDLHSREFGWDNETLLAEVRARQPDVIFTLGDLISRSADDEDVARMCDFLRALREIAPVFSSLGNHEEDYMKLTGKDLRPLIQDTGAILVDEQEAAASIAGNRICLGGTLGHLFPDGRSRGEYLQSPEYRMMNRMQDSGLPSFVLSHRPDAVIFENACEDWDVDLFLSGHTHGGVIRLPLAGGLYAPRQGFFPKYDKGMFQLERARLIISTGFAGYGWIPRIFNRPEITVLKISGK